MQHMSKCKCFLSNYLHWFLTSEGNSVGNLSTPAHLDELRELVLWDYVIEIGVESLFYQFVFNIVLSKREIFTEPLEW